MNVNYRKRGQIIDIYPERANLYPLILSPFPKNLYLSRKSGQERTVEEIYFQSLKDTEIIVPSISYVKRALLRSIIGGLKAAGYKVSRRFAKVIKTEVNYAPKVSGEPNKSLQIYRAFNLRVLSINNSFYLCLDHKLIVRAALSLAQLYRIDKGFSLNPSQRALLKLEDDWDEGRLIKVEEGVCHLNLISGSEITALSKDVFPELTRTQITRLAPAIGVSAQALERSIKQYSFLTVANAPRARLDACTEFAEQLGERFFPIIEGDITIRLESKATALRPPRFITGKDLQEPLASFDHVDQSKRAQDILAGLTGFGAYDKPASTIRLALITTRESKQMMERLVERLNKGSQRYPGARKTFGGEISIHKPLVVGSINDYQDLITEFVRSKDFKETDVALVFLPEDGNINDPHHPYYQVKGFLLKEGLVSQMVDKNTVYNPDWRDLNLALNIYAKAGNAPWVLDEAIPGVDLFIGLSSSQKHRGGRIVRMMGYVNVFDSYGRWRFYQGDSVAFDFSERLSHYATLVKNSVAMYRAENGGKIRSVHIHLTKKFSADERSILAKAVRFSAPGAAVSFVSINADHILRLYDLSDECGRIDRATYLQDDPGRLYLATTGGNIFDQRGMGTPIPLELTLWADPADAIPPLKDVAQQILSLTRLNWASTRSFCREPITTKYAGDIAKLMTIFMEDPDFAVNPILRGKPWFL